MTDTGAARRPRAGSWLGAVTRLGKVLRGVSYTDRHGTRLTPERGFRRWTAVTIELRQQHGTAYLVGNGASASMASHFAADLAKNAHVHTQVFTDLSLITAISNDIGYEAVYSEPLAQRAVTGDMLVAISSSGKSPNILRAVEVAAGHGLTMVTLSAMSEDNPLRTSGHLNIWIPARTYGEAETGHAAILHHWMDMVAAAPLDDSEPTSR